MSRTKNTTAKYPDLKLSGDAASHIVSGKNFRVSFDKKTGALHSFTWNGKEQVKKDFLPHFKRPLTDNDRRGWKSNRKLRQWYEPGMQLKSLTVEEAEKGMVKLHSTYHLINDSAKVHLVYSVNGNGVVKVDYTLDPLPGLPNIPKVGMQGGINRSFDQITWYGKGLLENYIDRNYGFDAAIYTQPIEEFMEPYAVPQENGNRTDVRWMFLADSKNEGLMVVADSLLSMSAWPYTEENIETAKHTNKLRDAGYLTLNIDLVQMGVGGNDSWSDVAAPLEKYQIPSKKYSYSFYLVPMKAASDMSAVPGKVRY